jgi:hypothetical protein
MHKARSEQQFWEWRGKGNEEGESESEVLVDIPEYKLEPQHGG